MKKTTKGAIAAAASASLLLGGAGSLAYWNTTDTVTAGSFNTGDLELIFTDCDNAKWILANGLETANNGEIDDVSAVDVVPGDEFTKTCEIPIVAVGDNLRATFGITGGGETLSAGLVDNDDVIVESTFKVGDTLANAATVTQITDDNNGDTVFVNIRVAFPITGADDGLVNGQPAPDNDSKNQSLVLTDYVVTATQVRS